MNKIELNTIISVNVEEVQDYGIFISYCEYKGMILVPNVSWDSVDHRELIHVGDTVNVRVIALHLDENDQIRFSGSIKHLYKEDDPWIFCSKLKIGDQVPATVVSQAPYGYFCSLRKYNYTLIENSKDMNLNIGDKCFVEVTKKEEDMKRVTVKFLYSC